MKRELFQTTVLLAFVSGTLTGQVPASLPEPSVLTVIRGVAGADIVSRKLRRPAGQLRGEARQAIADTLVQIAVDSQYPVAVRLAAVDALGLSGLPGAAGGPGTAFNEVAGALLTLAQAGPRDVGVPAAAYLAKVQLRGDAVASFVLLSELERPIAHFAVQRLADDFGSSGESALRTLIRDRRIRDSVARSEANRIAEVRSWGVRDPRP